nr:ribosomal protein S7 [Elakatothrix viridis]
MPRQSITKKRVLLPDPVYQSVFIHMFVNQVLKNGKKALAYKIVYNVLEKLGNLTKKNPIEVFDKALSNISPRLEIKPRRRAGSVQLIPQLITNDRSKAIGLKWILEVCRKKKGQSMESKLQSEILEAYKKTGIAFRKKEELHKLAVINAMYAKKPDIILNAINQLPNSNEPSNSKTNALSNVRSTNNKKNKGFNIAKMKSIS